MLEDSLSIDPFRQSTLRRLFAELSQRVTNEAYCLAEPGRQNAVFFTGDGDGRVQIELAPSDRSFELRWLDIATSRWGQSTTISNREGYMLEAPDGGHWVAVLMAHDSTGQAHVL